VEFEFKGRKTTPTDRLLIGANTRVDGRELRLFNTHLLAFFMINTETQDHPVQRRLVIEALRETDGPTLLGGDFNVLSHRALSRQFAIAGYRTVQLEQPTWRRDSFVLDHIFYSRHLRLLSHAVKPTRASDHHALVAEFELTSS
jgi:endonuclease/exonuclease/phosphatase (EEP) superfamily protein YafD